MRASMGAIRDLPKSDLGIDKNNEYELTWVVIPGKEKVIRDLRAAAKGASHVVLATDPDREGEGISWHIADELKLKNPLRVEFEEITKAAVEKALENPRPIHDDLVNSQFTRRVIDRLVGYEVSEVLWRKVKRGTSAGRVQSVALRLVCEREAEIDAFETTEYWTIEANLRRPGRQPDFIARLLTRSPVADEKESDRDADDGSRPEIRTEATAKEVAGALREATYAVRSVDKKEISRNPALPYSTSTLQQDASNRIRFNPRKTMQVAQQLYEGVDIGAEGPTGLITYMRTDETRVDRVSAEALAATRRLVETQMGPEYVRSSPVRAAAKKAPVAAQSAHEPIRPTDVNRTPDSLRDYLSPDQHRLYTLIWRRFVASQMASARFDTTRVDISAGQYTLRATGSILRFDGFYRVWEREVEGDEASGIPELAAGDSLDLLELKPEQHFTQPPPRYSEATLIKELEERGIGRPSTYAPTIETIEKRTYVKVLERRLHPTPLGKAVNAFLVLNFSHLVEYDFTARMEGDLDRIEEGEGWVPLVRKFDQELDAMLLSATTADPVRPVAERTGEACPKCGEGELVKREGRYGEFVGCSRFPECDYIKDKAERVEPVSTGRACPLCGKDLVVRQGRRGPFVGCSGYPDCRFIEKDAAEGAEGAAAPEGDVVEGQVCPQCSEGELVKKRGRFGEFLGCSRYPDCKYIHNQRTTRVAPVPTGRNCPDCGKPLVLRQSRRGPFVGCSGYPKCKHVERSESEPASTPPEVPAGAGV